MPDAFVENQTRTEHHGPGEQLEVVATDPGSARDIPAFIALSAHHLVESAVNGSQYRFIIRCGDSVRRSY